MISSFILDYMHLGFLGVMKKLIELFFDKLSHSSKNEISRRLQYLKQQIPDEFPRKCRPLKDLPRYKTTEYKLIALYLGSIIFKKILNEQMYNHFILFCIGSRLLWSKETTFTHTEIAKEYLKQFVIQLSSLYGRKAVVLNMHQLIHVSEDVLNTGCSLSEITAFPSENYLGKIKSLIRSPNRLLAQFCRRLHEQSYVIKVVPLTNTFKIIKMKNNEIIKLQYKQSLLSIKPPNNFVILQDNRIVEIRRIIYHEPIMIEGCVWNVKKPIFTVPINSSALRMWEMHNHASSSVQISINEIANKAIKLCLNFQSEGRFRVFVIPLLHE